MMMHKVILFGIGLLVVTALPLGAAESCVTARCHATLAAAKGVKLHDPVAAGDCTACHAASGLPHPGPKGGFKLAASGAALCEQCHDSMSKDSKGKVFPVVHSPVADGDCTVCHTPHGGALKGLLRAAAPALCEECHESKSQGKSSVHTPVKEGECLNCHAPHGAAKKGLLTKTGALLCAECHEAKATEKVKHPPALDDCQSCHDVHASNVKNQLLAAGNDLCYTCHDDKAKLKTMQNVHPIVEDSCLNCHKPHSGAEKGMLPARGDQLCASCHEKEATLATTAVSQHAAVKDGGCAACHDPHGTGQAKLLIDAQGTLCLGCHDIIKAKISTAKSQHQPVNDGECVACHNPHGAAFKPLLNAAFPQSFYAPYSTASYALCFGCHPRGLAEYTRTTLTRFSNGDRNLHELHVNKGEKGRTCRVCHSVHGADQDHLVRSISPNFGKWSIPINLQVTESGGTCVVGCHKPKSYDRYRPVSYQ